MGQGSLSIGSRALSRENECMQEVLGHRTEENHDKPRLDSQLHQLLEARKAPNFSEIRFPHWQKTPHHIAP